jgi:hypothetical protein
MAKQFLLHFLCDFLFKHFSFHVTCLLQTGIVEPDITSIVVIHPNPVSSQR